MRNLKRALSLTLASVMLLGMMVVGASAASYPDVSEEDNIEAIEVLQAVKVMIGDENGNFGPEQPVNRSQMAVVMALLLDLDYNYYQSTCPFWDVPSWAEPYVAACYANGIVSGYNATTYGAGDPVTAVQAASMMMRALGYFQYESDYADGFELSTVRQASRILLFDGVDANATDALTRNQVAKLALNALQTPIVEPEDNTLNITSTTGNTTVTMTGGQVNYVVTASKKDFASAIDNAESNGTALNGVQGYIIELGEQLYNGELKLRKDVIDDFGRPARYWEYKGEEIGTYAKKEQLKTEYTEKVTGKMLYDLLGSSTVSNYPYMLVSIDGNIGNDPQDFGFEALTRTNTDAVGGTGNGVLTQVYLDTENKIIYISIINTYLAIAEDNYNEKKDEVSLTVYSLDKNGKIYSKDTADKVTLSAAGDDFAIADVQKDDMFLVTVADGKIMSMTTPEVLTDETITSHKLNKYVVAGQQYDYTTTVQYDAEVLDSFTSDDMKEVTYNIILDKYGYLIGLERNEDPDQYVFVTGIDSAYSYLSQKNVPANIIFLDGTMKTVTMNAKKSSDFGLSGEAYSQVNTWCTYSVDSDGVYTLKKVAANTTSSKAAQCAQNAGSDIKINSKNISLDGSGSIAKVYGNDNTVYINAALANVEVDNGKYKRIVDDVDSVTVGVTNVDLIVKNLTSSTENDNSYDAPANEVYTLYKDNGTIIAVVTLDAEDNATVARYAYINSNSIDHRDYDAAAKEYSWYREAIVDGEFVMLKEVGDSPSSSYLTDLTRGGWYEIKYNSDDEVRGYLTVTYAASSGTAPSGTKTSTAVQIGTRYLQDANYVANELDKTFILQASYTSSHPELKYSGGTLYTGNDTTKGVYVSPKAKVVVFVDDYDDYKEFSGENMESALKFLNDKEHFNGYVNAVIGADGVATVVILNEKAATVTVDPMTVNVTMVGTDGKSFGTKTVTWNGVGNITSASVGGVPTGYTEPSTANTWHGSFVAGGTAEITFTYVPVEKMTIIRNVSLPGYPTITDTYVVERSVIENGGYRVDLPFYEGFEAMTGEEVITVFDANGVTVNYIFKAIVGEDTREPADGESGHPSDDDPEVEETYSNAYEEAGFDIQRTVSNDKTHVTFNIKSDIDTLKRYLDGGDRSNIMLEEGQANATEAYVGVYFTAPKTHNNSYATSASVKLDWVGGKNGTSTGTETWQGTPDAGHHLYQWIGVASYNPIVKWWPDIQYDRTYTITVTWKWDDGWTESTTYTLNWDVWNAGTDV